MRSASPRVSVCPFPPPVMGDHGDAAPETDRAKRKREAKVAFAQREEHDALDLRLRKVLLIPETQRSADQTSLLRAHATCVVSIVSSLEHRKARKATHTTRTEEREESKDSIAKKTAKLAELIRASRARGGFVLHTGAGFSTAAGVPDFRGQHGVWTMRAKGMHVPMPRFERCAPTHAHLACVALHANKFLKHGACCIPKSASLFDHTTLTIRFTYRSGDAKRGRAAPARRPL